MVWAGVDSVEEVVSSLDKDKDDGVKEKYVVHVSLPEIYGEGAWRREQMAELGEYRSLCFLKSGGCSTETNFVFFLPLFLD